MDLLYVVNNFFLLSKKEAFREEIFKKMMNFTVKIYFSKRVPLHLLQYPL